MGGDSEAVDGELHVGGVVGGSVKERFHCTHTLSDAIKIPDVFLLRVKLG